MDSLKFSHLSDEEWFNVALGRTQADGILSFGVPPENVQTATIGWSGDKAFVPAFEFYKFLKKSFEDNGHPIDAEARILDFGCGFGRIIRFWLREALAKNVIGVDVNDELLKHAAAGVPGCQFLQQSPMPPSHFDGNSFDLIYAYSIFSHLPENMISAWMLEFARILKPGGLLCVTTRPREHLLVHQDQKTAHSSLYAKLFGRVDDSLTRYDNGNLVHYPMGPSWGETMIPQQYAREKMSVGDLRFSGFFEGYSSEYLQPAIVFSKLNSI
jgi:ubiquinone/menaquinone biosynthesis C-methylase UbiE